MSLPRWAENPEVEEVIYNIMETYKKRWNNHVPGLSCWCKPSLNEGCEKFLIHRNYIHIEDGSRSGQWIPIREPQDHIAKEKNDRRRSG